MRKIDEVLERTTPTFFKTAIITSAFIGLIFTAQAQQDYTASVGNDFCAISTTSQAAPVTTLKTKEAFKTSLHDLYQQQVALTHTLIQAILDDSPSADMVKIALLTNQKQIADQYIPFYGKEQAAILTTLLYQHVSLTVDMVTAVRYEDAASIDNAVDSWKVNGKQIGAFFAQNDPSMKSADTKQMVRHYLKTTVGMGEAIYKNNVAAEMTAYNKALSANMAIHAKVADALIRNYPDKFGVDNVEPMVTQK